MAPRAVVSGIDRFGNEMMGIRLLAALALFATMTSAAAGDRVQQLLHLAPVLDGHNDLMGHYHACGEGCPRGIDGYDITAGASGHTDIARWRQGGVGAQLLNAGWRQDEPGLDGALKGFAFARELVARHPDDLVLARTGADVRQAWKDGRIAILLALEDPGRMGRDEATVRRLAAEGLRANVLAYSTPSELADGHAGNARHGGLSELGERMVGWMQQYGVLVDLSHASAETARDVLSIARAPVIFSHSNAASLVDLPRNVPDDVLRLLSANGGIVMVGFVPYFASKPFADWYEAGDAYWAQALAQEDGDRARAAKLMAAWEREHPAPDVGIGDIADHIEHVRNVAGIEHVGLGSDFDGISFTVDGLGDVAAYPRLLEELVRRGWSDDDLAKLTSGNFLRVLDAADVAARP